MHSVAALVARVVLVAAAGRSLRLLRQVGRPGGPCVQVSMCIPSANSDNSADTDSRGCAKRQIPQSRSRYGFSEKGMIGCLIASVLGAGYCAMRELATYDKAEGEPLPVAFISEALSEHIDRLTSW